MAARTVAVKLTAEVGSYITGMKQAAAATKDLASKTLDTAEKNKAALNEVGLALGAIGAAAAVGVGMAVKRFAEFDQAMANVQAATHESAEAMGDLRDAALDAGAKTSFSATEAAGAIEELAKAGVSTRDILGGGLAGALDLAAAGSLEVGAAAEIAATALVQFGLDGAKVPHVADLLAAAAGKAQGSVGDMGMALKQVGLVANSTGLTIEETTAGLASFASAGLIGSDAGTSFKAMLQRLNPQSVEAATLMDKLGFSAYDSQGNFIGLEKLAAELTESFAGMTDEQRNAAMATLFGSDAVRAATVLYDQGAAGIADWTSKVNDQGYAAETAAIKLDTLNGDLEALGGAFETALIGTGSSANGVLREMVQAVTGVVNAYSAMPAPVQAAVLGVGTFTAGVGLAGGAALFMIPKIAELRTALVTLGISARATSLAMSTLKFAAIGAGATAAVFGVDAIARAMADAQPSVNSFRDAVADFGTGAGTTGAIAKVFGDDLGNLSEMLDRASQSQWFSTDWGTTTSDVIEAKEAVNNIDEALAQLASSGYADVAKKQFDALSAAAVAQGVSVDELKARFPQYSDALTKNTADAKLTETQTTALGGSQDALAGSVMDATGEVKSETEALVDNMAKTRDATGLILGLRDANRGYQAALDTATESLKTNGKTLDTNTEKGRANETALDGIASSANDVLTSMVASGKPYAEVSAALGTQRAALIAAATSFGMTKAQAVAYADSVVKIPKEASTTVTAKTDAASGGITRVRGELEGLDGKEANPTVKARTDAAIGGIARVRRDLEGLDGRTATVTTIQRTVYVAQRDGVGGGLQRAGGGWVFGPGTATSDSIPAALSNGEFVVNARSAGQNAALLEAINSNRFANGGWVGGSAVQMTAASSTSGAGAVVHWKTEIHGDNGDQVQRSVGAVARELAFNLATAT